ISVWATSSSGETQTATQTIKLSKQALFLSTNIGTSASLNEVRKLIVHSKNIEGKPINTKAMFRLIKLKSPKEIIEPKEEEIMPRYKLIQDDEPSLLSKLKHDYEVTKSQITTNRPIDLIRDLKPGAYVILLESTDRFGEKVTLEQPFVLFDENAQQAPLPFFFWTKKLNEKAEVDETASILLSTALKNLYLLYEVESQGKIIHSEWIKLSNEQRKLDFKIQEEQRGGITFHLTAVHSNRLINQKEFVAVPFSNKKLQVDLTTFRDLIKPGAKEKWTVQLKDQNGKAVEAEILAGMYDQSLDVFRLNDWSMNIYQQAHSRLNWQNNTTFLISLSSHHGSVNNSTYYPSRFLPQLNWFGFYLSQFGRYNKQPM